jgi:hypothetical protein
MNAELLWYIGGALAIFAFASIVYFLAKTIRLFSKKAEDIPESGNKQHNLKRFSHWTVYCSKCDTEFQDPNGERKLPFPNEATLPKLSDNPQCNGVH